MKESHARPLGYEIIHIDVERPPATIAVPQGRSGIAFVLRRGDCPIDFWMEALPPGSMLDSKQIAARLIRRGGTHILRDQIFNRMRQNSDFARFPSLDIAVCTHNRTDRLARCLQSLEEAKSREDPSRIRILVIDNAPSDRRTAELAARLPNIAYVLEKKAGLNFARNRALHESSAELIAFVDDDATVDRCWISAIHDAWRVNPDAGAFVGPVLPLELDTEAQVIFEEMGGFGRHFEPGRFGRSIAELPTYPLSAGMIGTGCNMAFRRELLIDLGGFDEALDTGAPLPGGGDLDMFYRVVSSGHAIAREPKMVVYHQHRRKYSELRRQMWTWGLTTMAYITKCYKSDPEQRPRVRKWIAWWFAFHLSRIVIPYLRGDVKRRPSGLVIAELSGGVVGLLGEYERSVKRVAAIKSGSRDGF